MRRFVVGYVNFFDNELILELIEAGCEHEAVWKHSKLQSDDWDANVDETKGMSPDEIQTWSFDFDMLISVLEVK